MKRRLDILLVVLVMAAAGSVSEAVLQDSINATQEPVNSPWDIIAEVGWLYTPVDSYYLTGIASKFGPFSANGSIGPPFPGTIVTVEVYEGVPGKVPAAVPGTSAVLPLPLRSTSFSLFQWGVVTGGTFAPLELTGGEDYFIGFAFTGPGPVILKNTTIDAGATALPCYGDDIANGTYSFPLINPTEVHPILLFEGEPVPEPGTVLLLGLGGAALLRKKHKAFL